MLEPSSFKVQREIKIDGRRGKSSSPSSVIPMAVFAKLLICHAVTRMWWRPASWGACPWPRTACESDRSQLSPWPEVGWASRRESYLRGLESTQPRPLRLPSATSHVCVNCPLEAPGLVLMRSLARSVTHSLTHASVHSLSEG